MRGVHDELAGLDLNLVLALDALLVERHVTRAAARLGVSQSAASHALARLRDLLGDPLLVRGPRGAMQPTPRALALAPLVGRALADLAAALRPPEAFVPATARRTFHLGAGDYAEFVLLPRLAARLASAAPGIDLFIRTVPDDIPSAIAQGDVDAVIAPARPLDVAGPGTYQRLLFEETFVCAVRAGHPAARKRLTLERYCSLDHVLIAPRGTYGSFVDSALEALRMQRRVALAVPHFLIVPHVVASTDLIVTIPSRIAATFRESHQLATLRPPAELGLAGFPVHLIWHERAHADDAQRWFREQIVAVAGGA